MWAGLIAGDPRVVRATRKEAIDAAKEWQLNHREYKGPIHAVGVDVKL
jgi:hypothetical protein